nr:prolipoprotein diacylglyceryl transferase [Desulforamulus aquiferis]
MWPSGTEDYRYRGAVLGGLLAVVWYSRRNSIPFWPMADTLAPGLLMGQAVGRMGCFLNGCCFGIPHSFGVAYPVGSDANFIFGSQKLFPAVLFEAGWDILVLALLLKIFTKKPFDGFIALSYFILYSVGRFTIEFWRGDSLRTIMDFKVAQLTSIITIIVSVALMVYLANASKGHRDQQC